MEEVKKHVYKFNKKMVPERFDEHFSFFKFKCDFNAFCYSKTLKIFTPFLQCIRVAVFLELVVFLKLARMSLWFVILLGLRGERMR